MLEESETSHSSECNPKRKKQKTGLLQNPLSKTINWNSSTTTASSCDNKFIKSELLDKKKTDRFYNCSKIKQIKKEEKKPVLSEKPKCVSEISQIMLRVQEDTLELNREELHVRQEELEIQKGILQELKEMKELFYSYVNE